MFLGFPKRYDFRCFDVAFGSSGGSGGGGGGGSGRASIIENGGGNGGGGGRSEKVKKTQVLASCIFH